MVEALEQADVDAGHVTTTFVNDSALPGTQASVVPGLTSDHQLASRIHLAQASTLLFDISEGIAHDFVSRMLGCDCGDNPTTQEIACEHTLIRLGRLLTYSLSACDGVERDDLPDEELPLLGNKADVDSVLSLIPGNAFLPGIDHLSNAEVRSTFVNFDAELQALQQATAKFLADHRSGESIPSDHRVSLELPGESFLLPGNTTNVGLSIQHPTAESLLTTLDELLDGGTLVEDVADTNTQLNQHLSYPANVQQPCNEDAPRQSAVFNTGGYQYTAYTALDQSMGSFNVSRPVSAQS